MKRILIYVIAAGVILGGVTLIRPHTIEYITQEGQTIENTVEVDALQKRIDDAINASSTAIEAAAQQAYEDAKVKAQTEIELEVTQTYNKEIDAREAALEERVSL